MITYVEQAGSTNADLLARLAAGEAVREGDWLVTKRQLAGRGRQGRTWFDGAGNFMGSTVVRPAASDPPAPTLALVTGLAVYEALLPLCPDPSPVMLKWPNDLQVAGRKLGGVLIEVRWRGTRLDWVAIGVGINRQVPADVPDTTAVRADVSRDDLLLAVAPALRRAATGRGPLTPDELARWHARDAARGRYVSAPAAGLVLGITAAGGIRIRGDDGVERICQSGSLVFA